MARGKNIALWSSLVLAPLFAVAPAGGQNPAPLESPKFSAGVDLVELHATVTNRKGAVVGGLEKDNFRVFEDGQPQNIRIFQHEDVPVAVGLAVDNSGSMRRKRKDVTDAALAFVRSSNSHDRMFIVNFNEHVTFGLPNTELFSADSGELEAALNGVPATGRTALYDAIDVALAHLAKAKLDKKVLIVISDGGDNASHHTLAETLAKVERSPAIVYTVGLFDEYDSDRNPGVLKKIASATGGEMFELAETSAVVPICERIASDIRNQYTIGYVPADSKRDNAYRAIKVTAAGRHGEKYLVRTRTGYVASPDPQKLP
jgi:VWFA-related protein